MLALRSGFISRPEQRFGKCAGLCFRYYRAFATLRCTPLQRKPSCKIRATPPQKTAFFKERQPEEVIFQEGYPGLHPHVLLFSF